ncbi:unnamed protein product (macronuclear) [Paramecium tetraurelia]|uniref:Uncharacterized protein n=1 Tax=Paramecium tetraurelia TaxID=5888 RepID=A0C5V7_PARTE|nr:uncharacterized protein GSPATT00035303001 [Paramecium tetraurelia]CAK66174.1 unnamed protein product [Paramecium tetraurelia]|eukprot:XP_001433571.1 hypothetical protein (macronuclear) [Paramecium tetraurelia strain d4-2]
MNFKKSNVEKVIELESLETIWIHHLGFLERIAQENRIRFFYSQNLIILEGDAIQCENAAQRIYQLVDEDFIMQVEEFRNDNEIQAFHQLFQQDQYRELCKSNPGFWIYSKSSLNKQISYMNKLGYQPSGPDLPRHFFITWFPRTNMLQIQEWIFQKTGYLYNQQSLKDKFKFHQQYNITALEAISIYLNLDVQEIMNKLQLIIELAQTSNQFFLVINANNLPSIDDGFRILENHLANKRFWPIANLEMKLSSNDLLYLEKTIDDQVSTSSRVQIYSSEEVFIESKRLDKQFSINLNRVLIQRYSSDQIFVCADQYLEGEITDIINQTLRKPKNNLRADKDIRFHSQFYYNESSNKPIPNKNNQKKGFPSMKQQKCQKNPFQFYDQTQFEQQQLSQKKNSQQQSSYQQSSYQQSSNYNYREETVKNEDSNNQQDQQLKFYRKHQNIQDIPQMPKNIKYNKKQQKEKQQKYINQNEDISMNFDHLSVSQNLQNSFIYQYTLSQEQENTSQLLQVEDLNKTIRCQVIKIELMQYQIIYTQSILQNGKKFNFQELQNSFEEFQNIYYDLQHEITLEFSADCIKMNIKCKQQDEINQIKQIFHNYFLQQMHYVTQYSTQAQDLIDILKQNCKVEYFLTKTELSEFLNEKQFRELQQIDDGQQVAIKVSNYSYRHHQFLKGRFDEYMNKQSLNENSSISIGANNTKVIIISEDQLKYLETEFPSLEACQLRKFKDYFKMAFYFVQIEDIEELLEKAKVEFRRMNSVYIKAKVQKKRQDNKNQWMKEIRNDQHCEASKLYCYSMMEAFNTELLNDIIDIQMNIEEYQANQNLSMYYEATIELGDRELNPSDPDNIENLLFESDFKCKIKQLMTIVVPKLIDQHVGRFITLWIRNEKDKLSLKELIQKNKILPRGYFQKK